MRISQPLASRRPAIEQLETRLALTSQLLLDYNTVELPFEASHFTELNGESFFVSNAGFTQNIEIWKTDGSEDEPSPVAEVDSENGRQLQVISMVRLEDKLVFLASEGDPPELRLYVSDGTSTGTREVMRANYGGVSSSGLEVVNGLAYFSVSPWHGSQMLMVTDGTKDGTRILGSQKGPTDNFAVIDGGQFFVAGGNTTRRENGQYVQFATQLWFHDEVTGTARVVREIDSGKRDDYADPLHLTAVGKHVYFSAETALGRELWFSDSTTEGTKLVQDLRPGASSSDPSLLTAVRSQLYFLADDGRGITLWLAERLNEAFRVVPAGAPFGLVPNQLAKDADSLYVLAESAQGFDVFAYSTSDGTLLELGRVDGTNPLLQQTRFGTGIVAELNGQHRLTLIGENSLVDFPQVDFARFLGESDTFTYIAAQGSAEVEIWYTEGTPESTRLVGTVESHHEATTIGESVVLNVRKDGRAGLWRVDPDGLAEIAVPMPRNGSSTYHSLEVLNNQAIVVAEPRINEQTYYTAWQADTLVANATESKKLIAEPFVWGNHGGWPDQPRLHAVGNEYYFAAQTQTPTGGYREEVWKTDLTPEGTERSSFDELSALDPTVTKDEPFGFYPTRLEPPGVGPYIEFNDRSKRVVSTSHGSYFLNARFENGGRVDELYRVVGNTPPQLIAETGLLPSHHSFHLSQVAGHPQIHGRLIVQDDILYFVGSDLEHGVEVWRSDGSVSGTYMLADLNPQDASSEPSYVGTVNGKLFVTATSEAHGREVWSITPAGETRLYDIREGMESSSVLNMGNVDNTLFVSADDGRHGREVWAIRPDDSLELFDIQPGEASSDPFSDDIVRRTVARLGEEIYFSADDGIHGRELWVIDGQTVRLERDIRPGPIGSYPIIRAQLADAILFVADDGDHGRELWSIVPDINIVVGDANGDGDVSFVDFLILSAHYGRPSTAGAEEGDFDGNGVVDYLDFVELANAMSKAIEVVSV